MPAMGTIHIAEAEAARDFSGVLAQVRAGNEVVIQSETNPVVIRQAGTERPGRTLEDSIQAMKTYEEKFGQLAVMDTDFAADMEEIIRSRRPGSNMWEDE